MTTRNQWEMEVTKTLTILAAIYDPKMSKESLEAYLVVLRRMDITASDVAKAADVILNDPKQTRFPLPAQLKAALGLTDDQMARDAVSRIVECVHNSSGNERRAREKIGELGWRVVQRYGGWEKITRAYPEAADIAQWRELAVTLITQVKAGMPDTPPSLEMKSSRLIPDVGKMLAFDRNEKKQ